MAAHLRTDGDIHRIEAAVLLFGQYILDRVIEDEAHAQGRQTCCFLFYDVAGQAVSRDAEMQHAARHWTAFMNFDLVAEPRQVIGGAEPARTGADHQRALAGWRCFDRHGPIVGNSLVAEEALDGVNAHGAVQMLAVAARFAGVVAHAPVNGGERIVADQHFPRILEAACLRMVEPALDVLAGRAGVIAGRQQIHVHGVTRAHRSHHLPARRVDGNADIGLQLGGHWLISMVR